MLNISPVLAACPVIPIFQGILIDSLIFVGKMEKRLNDKNDEIPENLREKAEKIEETEMKDDFLNSDVV
jgi:hypothetical protein